MTHDPAASICQSSAVISCQIVCLPAQALTSSDPALHEKAFLTYIANPFPAVSLYRIISSRGQWHDHEPKTGSLVDHEAVPS